MHSIDRNGVGRKLGRPPGRTGGAEGLWVDPIARVEIRGGELIECGSVDEAVEIAASHPLSQIGGDRGAAALGELLVVVHVTAGLVQRR
jgi:hypothetical protein